jgi:plastocyanin
VLFVLFPMIGCDPASEPSKQPAESNGISATRPTPNGLNRVSRQAAETPLDTKPLSKQKSITDSDHPITTVRVSHAATSATGTIAGTVIYEADPKRRWRYSRYYITDRKKGRLAEAVVGLRSTQLKKLAPPSEPKEITINQKETRFTPETVAIRSGDNVRFTNSDPFIHNVHTTNPLCRFDDSIKTGQSFSQMFTQSGGIHQPIVLGCRFHSVMQSWVFVFDHPWFQITSTDGRFRLEKVPPGTYQLQMAHPAGELEWSQRVEVKAGETVTIDIRVSPDNLSNSGPFSRESKTSANLSRQTR